MSLDGTDEQKLEQLSQFNYKEQAIWFLNAFWNDFAEKEANTVWDFKHLFDEIDFQKGKEGSQLDELLAHRFLERIKATLSVRDMRNKLREVGIEKVKYVPLCNYLVFHYSADWHKLVNASQGDNQEELEQAQKMLEAAQVSCTECQKAADESRAAEEAARKAREELEAALADLKAQEDAYNNKTKELERKSEEGGVVSRNRAKNELAQHLGEDPLPLRRAKLTTEAARKKSVKAEELAVQKREEAEAALQEAEAAVQAAEDYLKEVRNKGGSGGQATMWWMERELEEAKKYLPSRRQ